MTVVDVDAKLVVSEVFGPTIQGEGPSTGRRALFVRLGRCNLDCSWCDTPYTWDWRGKNGIVFDPAVELHDVKVHEFARSLSLADSDLLVITGGEPLLQQRALARLLDVLDHDDTEIETNGTLAPLPRLAQRARFNVSPKLSGSGVARERAINLDVLTEFDQQWGATFKFVCVDEHDLFAVDRLVSKLGLHKSSVWIMPEGRTSDELRSRVDIVEGALSRGYNVSARVHVLLWGDVRGR